MKNPNNSAMFLPRDQVFRWTDLSPEERLVHLQEQINQIAWETEAKIGGQKKAGTRHNLALGTGFRNVTAGVPDGWTSAGAGVTFSQQANRPGGDTRNYSARIAAGANAGTLTQSVPVFPGQRMSMAVWVKVTSGSGYVSLVTNGTNPHTNKVKFSSTDGTAGFIALPSLKLTAPMVEIPTDATTVTLTLAADANSTIDFCEVQYGHGTQRVPHLWVDATGDYESDPSSATFADNLADSVTVGSVIQTLITPYTEPAAADFTVLNSATLTDVSTDIGDGVHTVATSSGSTGTQALVGGYKSMNYTSGTITLTAGFTMLGTANAYGCGCLFFRESATGKITTYELTCIGSNRWQIQGSDLSGPAGATWVRAPTGVTASAVPNMVKFFLKVTYDGTDMKCYISADKVSWRQYGTVSKTEYFTTAPDQWGWGANANTDTGNVDLTLIHWLVS